MATQATTVALRERVAKLFTAHVDAVFNVGYRITWNRADAEDITQATFVKALTRLDQLHDDARARPWLLKVAYREALTVLRKRRDVPTDPTLLPHCAGSERRSDDQAMAADLSEILSGALSKVAEAERTAVVLRDIEQLPMRDVADVMGIGLSAAKMRVHRGRQALRKLLEGHDLW